MPGLLYLSIGVGNSAGFSLKLEKCLGLVPHSSTQIDTMFPGIEEKAKTLVSSHKGSSLSLPLWRNGASYGRKDRAYSGGKK